MILRGTAIDNIPDLTLAFAIDKDTGELTGTLTDGLIGTPVLVKGWHNPWVVSTNAALNQPATAFATNPHHLAHALRQGRARSESVTAG